MNKPNKRAAPYKSRASPSLSCLPLPTETGDGDNARTEEEREKPDEEKKGVGGGGSRKRDCKREYEGVCELHNIDSCVTTRML